MLDQDAQFYVSMKGVILSQRRVLMLRKPGGVWDLPGGRLSADEAPKLCLIREIQEETGLKVEPGALLHRWVRHRPDKLDVFLVSHICKIRGTSAEPVLSSEHDELGWFSELDIEMLMPSKGIRKSVQRAFGKVK